MKLNKLFLGAIAALASTAMVACSDDDAPSPGLESGETGYVAVNIVQPKSSNSRDNAADKFRPGTDDENKAETGLFFIYNSSGTEMINEPQTVSLSDGGTQESNSPYREKIYNAILVIDGEKVKPTVPLQIVCVLNAPSALESLSKTTSLSDLKKQIADYGAREAGKFIMTNSVYMNGTDEVCGAEVSDENLKKSAAEALNAPVDIYVERVVAKIQVKSASSFTNKGASVAIDGKETSLTIKVSGIEIANIAEKSYLMKDISNISYSWTWNDPANKRSYWETVPVTTGDNPLTFSNKKYKDIATDPDFNIAAQDFMDYVQPNTSDQKTSVLVTAQLMNGTDPVELVYIRGGYTTNEGAKNVIATYLQSQKYWKLKPGSNTEFTSIAPEDLEWKNNNDIISDGGTSITSLKGYQVIAQVKSTVTGLRKRADDGTYSEVNSDEINEYLKSSLSYAARVYTEGKCYYYVNIDQTPVAEDNGHTGTEKFEGVIRNHIYELTLNSIEGIGTPVFDPDNDEIIPDTPGNEQLWFLGARVNVLKWRLVPQSVNFGQ